MANRLTKIVTRTGDDGTTGLADGSRLSKSALRVETMGAVDELNSVLGLLLSEPLPDSMRACLDGVQHDLFDLGGELSVPGHTIMSEAHCTRIEDAIARFNADLTPLKDFILPGGTRAASLAHVARTACRRAERCVIDLQGTAGTACTCRIEEVEFGGASSLITLRVQAPDGSHPGASFVLRRSGLDNMRMGETVALRIDGTAHAFPKLT